MDSYSQLELASKMFTNSDPVLFRAAGTMTGFSTLDIPRMTDSQIKRNQTITMDLDQELTGVDRLIDEVCSSDLMTPDISVFDEFDCESDVDINRDFRWPETTVSNKSLNNSTLINPQSNTTEFSFSPASPNLYVDNETFEDSKVQETPEKDDENDSIIQCDANSVVDPSFQQLFDDDLSFENKIALPLIEDTQDSMAVPSSNTYQEDCSQEFSNLYNGERVKNTCIPADNGSFVQRNNKSDNFMMKKEQIDFERLCDFDVPDLETVDKSAIDDINAEVAMNYCFSNSNILSDAIKQECHPEEELTPDEIDEKVNSFFSDSVFSTEIVQISNNLPISPVLKPVTSTASPLDILNLFKSSPFGKACGNNAVLKNVKIIVPPEHTKHFPVNNSGEVTLEPIFVVKSTDSLNSRNEGMPRLKGKGTEIRSIGIKRIKNKSSKICPNTPYSSDITPTLTSDPDAKTTCNPFANPSGSGAATTSVQTGRKRTVKSETSQDFFRSEAIDGNYSDDSSVSNSRNKRSKLSLKGLSEAEKYRRIREQNNIASKKCREKKKKSIHSLGIEIEELNVTNSDLKLRFKQLEAKVATWKLLWKSIQRDK